MDFQTFQMMMFAAQQQQNFENFKKKSKKTKIGVFWELRHETLPKKRFRPGDFKKHGFGNWFWIFGGFLIYQPTYQTFLVYNKKNKL